MDRAISIVAFASVAALVGGCAGHRASPDSDPLSRVVTEATPAQKAASFDQVAGLAGDWRLTDDNGVIIEGANAATSRFEVTSGGKVVREIMFVGNAHEMTNLYHLDGEELVVTHYCAVGNQPRMRAASVTPGRIAFKLDSITNFTSKDQICMGSLVLEMPNADTVRQVWISTQNGKTLEPTVITLRRVK